MKRLRVRILNWINRRAKPNSRVQQATAELLLMESLGIRWYSPLWHAKNAMVLIKRLMQSVRREIRGYQQPVWHPNPEAVICAEFTCLRSIDGKCASTQMTEECANQCFGMKRNEQGKFVSLFQDPEGNPAWIELSCRDCKKYLTECKGIAPNAVNPLKQQQVEPSILPLRS